MDVNAKLDNLFRRVSFHDDQEAFKELFFDFYPSLCVFAKRYISSPETCEDIVQDTFFHLWKNRKRLEITSSFRNLLITSIKNSCVDYLRKQSVRQHHVEKQTVSVLADAYPGDTPEIIYTIKELEEMLRATLAKLPENARRAFELSRFENMTYYQIAEEMSVSSKTVEAYISKVLSVLRIELKDYLPLVLLAYGIAYI